MCWQYGIKKIIRNFGLEQGPHSGCHDWHTEAMVKHHRETCQVPQTILLSTYEYAENQQVLYDKKAFVITHHTPSAL